MPVTIDINEVKSVSKNLDALGQIIAVKSARIAAVIAIDLLTNAQPRVPYDTGELRRSGKAVLTFGSRGYLNVASGNEDGTVTADLGKISAERIKGSKSIRAYVQYSKFNADGEDVTSIIHYNLFPYGSPSHPHALFPGTGPLFLENPWLERQSYYLNIIKEDFSALPADLAKIAAKRSTKRMAKFMVENIELNIHKYKK